eukprot:9821513-Ditylum_brightwellii.AAC.1
MEGFTYATSLDPNMGYYHIEISPVSSAPCTIVLHWGKCKYLKLPMGLCNILSIFKEKMSKIFANIKEVRAYINDLLLITNDNWGNNLKALDNVLDRLKCVGLKKKVQGILRIAPLTTRKQLCSFKGMINYYCDMWQGHSEALAPLLALMSKSTPWKWTSVK